MGCNLNKEKGSEAWKKEDAQLQNLMQENNISNMPVDKFRWALQNSDFNKLRTFREAVLLGNEEQVVAMFPGIYSGIYSSSTLKNVLEKFMEKNGVDSLQAMAVMQEQFAKDLLGPKKLSFSAIIDNLESLEEMAGQVSQGIDLSVTKKLVINPQGELLETSGISPASQRYLNEGMVTALFNVLTENLSKDEYTAKMDGTTEAKDSAYAQYLDTRLSNRMELSDLVKYSGDVNVLYSKISNAYGGPNTYGSVYASIADSLEDLYDRKLTRHAEASEGSLEKKALAEELDNLDLWLDEGGLLETLWPTMISNNIHYLQRLGIDLNADQLKVIREDEENSSENLEDKDTVVSRDTLGIRAANEINPLTRVQTDIKLILKTLPRVMSDGSPMLNKLGVPRLADFGKNMSILYTQLANTADNWSKVMKLQDLAEKDVTFKVLLRRLGLEGVDNIDDLNELTKTQFDLYTSFMIAFDNSNNAYSLMNVTQDGNRTIINSNAEQIDNLVKLKWGENFKYNIQTTPSLGRVTDNQITINLDYKMGKDTLRTLLDSKLQLEQKLDILETIGIKFTDREAAEALIEQDDDIQASIGWIFKSLLDDSSLTNIMEGDESNNLKKLIEVQKDTDMSVGSLQFTTVKGKKKYSITLKGFLDVMKDNLNDDVLRGDITEGLNGIPSSPTFMNSAYIQRLNRGEKIEVGVINGIKKDTESQGKEISSTTKANIIVLHIGSILQGSVPLIRVGNKKEERTIRVGTPNYSRGMVSMKDQMIGYLHSEIKTAHAINTRNVKNIKGLEGDIELQYFNSPAFVSIQAEAKTLYMNKKMSEEALSEFLKSPEVSSAVIDYLSERTNKTKELLLKYGMIQKTPSGYVNTGLDPRTIGKIMDDTAPTMGTKEEMESLEAAKTALSSKGIISESTLHNIASQITFIREEGIIEQIKLFLGHPAVYEIIKENGEKKSDLFKRTSGMVSPKKFPDSSESTMNLMDEHYPNQNGKHRRTARFITRKEVKEDSVYIDKYTKHLETLGRPDLIDIVKGTYTNMEIFDGGGLINLDFYRKVRKLTDSWPDAMESAYQKVINGEQLTKLDLVMFDPLKPQVFAPISQKGIDLRVFNKFALFPIHPNLSKLVMDQDMGSRNVLDSLYEDMVNHDLDYNVFESGTKVGAKMNQDGGFDSFIDEEGDYTPLKDVTSIQEYDLKYFGVQQDPKGKRDEKVSVGTQSTSMLPANVYSNGMLSAEYADTSFSSEETWEQAIDRYHNLTTHLITRDMNRLASKLGFTRTEDNDFRLIDEARSRENTKAAILSEMDKRDLPQNVKDTITLLFDSPGSTHINQLYEKSKIETILTAILTNTVIARKTKGELVVLQSNLGLKLENKAIKQKDSNVQLDRKLKFYDINDETGRTTAMEVYLPHYFKEYLGENIDINNIDKKALELIGFRIPTEGLNSVDFIDVVGFLPQSAGSNIIVPSEMVAKTGADFDIDKLTLYMPNTEEVGGRMQAISHIKIGEDGRITQEEFKRLRGLDPHAYSDIINKVLPPKIAQDRLNQLALGEDLNGLDENLASLNYSDFQILDVQPKQVLQNELIGFMRELLSHPASFPQLITPVGALDLAVKAKEIHAIQNPTQWENGKQVKKSLGESLSLENIIDTTFDMYQTLGGTGVVASSLTHHAKSQRSGLQWNPDLVEFNFEGIDPTAISLSNAFDFDRGHINASMQKYISAYVDGEKDPFAMYVNAGKDMAGVHMTLLRSGIPLETVLMFMSQPIIHEYVELINTGRSETTEDFMYLPGRALIAKYGSSPAYPEALSKKLLNSMLDAKFETMSPIQKALQSQIMEDFLRYKDYSVALMELQKVTSYDTTKLKNGNEVIYLKALERKVKKQGMFLDAVDIAEESERVQPSFLKPLRDLFMNSKNLLAHVDLKNSSAEMHNRYIDIAENLINQDIPQDNVVYYLNSLDNFVSAYVILQSMDGFTTLADKVEKQFVGEESLPRRLGKAKRSADNLAIDNLLPILDTQVAGSPDSKIDSIRLIGKKYDVEDVNDLVEEMKNLKVSNPKLYRDLIQFSLAQTGLSFSPYAYHGILPGEDVLELTSSKYNNFISKIQMEGSLPQTEWNKMFNSFISNSWSNNRIVPQKYTKKQAFIKHLSKDEIALEVVPDNIFNQAVKTGYINIVHLKNKENKTYYQDVFKIEGKMLVRQEKRGIPGRFIETSGSIVPSNIHVRPLKTLHLGVTNINKVLEGKKDLHILPKAGVNGKYRLPDNTIVELTMYKASSKLLTGETKQAFAVRDALDLPHKNTIFAFANRLGFENTEAFKKSGTNFYKSFVDVASIKVLERGTGIVADSLVKVEKIDPKVNPKIAEDYNNKNNDC